MECFKLVTLYRRVDDEQALEAFFSGTHLPLAEQLPGLIRSEVSRIGGKPGGESRFHLMYELYFESRDAYTRAMTSEPGVALVQALAPWDEARIITWFYGTSYGDMAAGEMEQAEEDEAEEDEL